MEKGIIMTMPRHDDVTEYLSQFSKQIEKTAIEKSINLKKLEGNKATKEELEKAAEKLDYRMIIFNGHGSAKTIEGHKETIIIARENDSLLKERIVYARTCNSAAILGKECTKDTKKGCFIGYDRPFQFYVNIKWDTNPLKDNTARLFLEPSNIVPISLMKGNTANDSNENSKKSILKNIKKIIRKRNSESYKIAEALWNNYQGQTLLGNPEAKL